MPKVRSLPPLRSRPLLVAAVVLGGGMAAPPKPQETPKARYFSIETGSAAGSNFAAGATIATILSHPPGAIRCRVASACGPPGMVATAVSSQSAVAAARDVAAGRVESALIPANIAAAAYRGRDAFKADGARQDLRAVARLYSEVVQIAALKGRVKNLADLKRRAVAIDVDGTASRDAALALFSAAGFGVKSMKLSSVDPDTGIAQLEARKVDAVVLLAPVPSAALSRLAERTPIDLVAVPAGVIKNLDRTIYARQPIPAAAYRGVPDAASVSVGMLWIVPASADADLVAQLTSALWDEANVRFFTPDTLGPRAFAEAVSGLPVPLHPGAERFYRQRGLLPAPAAERAALNQARPNR